MSDISSLRFSAGKVIALAGEKYYYFICEINFKACGPIIGYGVSRDRNSARSKAFMEAVERYALGKKKESCMGSSARLSKAAAAHSANVEAIERDAFIRWANGLRPTERRTIGNDVVLLSLASMMPEIKIVLAGLGDWICVPMGLGAGRTIEEAQEKAVAELVLSVVRHQANPCERDESLHGRVHRGSMKAEFKQRFFLEPPLAKPKTRMLELDKNKFEVEFIFGCHWWPIHVAMSNHCQLAKWDLEWFEKTGIVFG